jgi:hypothetical protein
MQWKGKGIAILSADRCEGSELWEILSQATLGFDDGQGPQVSDGRTAGHVASSRSSAAQEGASRSRDSGACSMTSRSPTAVIEAQRIAGLQERAWPSATNAAAGTGAMIWLNHRAEKERLASEPGEVPPLGLARSSGGGIHGEL